MATHEDAYLLRDLTRDLLLAGRLWRKMARHAASEHGVSEAASAPLIWIGKTFYTGPNGGYLVITKAKKAPRERRGFAGAATVDPLKAAKRAAKKA